MPARLESAGITRFGVWATALHSTYITNPVCGTISQWDCEFNPEIQLLDPEIDAARTPSKINEFVQTHAAVGISTLWFARPCNEILGASITYNPDGTYAFTGGTFREMDLRNTAERDRAYSKLDYFIQRGVDGFYFDAMWCPGDSDFIQYVKDEAQQRYGKDILIIREGALAKDAHKTPQIPFIKPSGTGSYNYDASLLISFIAPNATYYGGYINTHLTSAEFDDLLNDGYQPVLGLAWDQSYITQYQSQVQRGYQNQLKSLHSSCPVPVNSL
jgi:hypothetical protein